MFPLLWLPITFQILHEGKQFIFKWESFPVSFIFFKSDQQNANKCARTLIFYLSARVDRKYELIYSQIFQRIIKINNSLIQFVRNVLWNIGLVIFWQLYGPRSVRIKERDQLPHGLRTFCHGISWHPEWIGHRSLYKLLFKKYLICDHGMKTVLFFLFRSRQMHAVRPIE